MYDVSTIKVFVRYKTVLYLTKTLVVETSYIVIISLSSSTQTLHRMHIMLYWYIDPVAMVTCV